MALHLYDSDKQLFGVNPLRSVHRGHRGSTHEQVIYIRNENPTNYYVNITVTPEIIGVYNDTGEFGTTGWGMKALYGERQPTEAEWDLVRAGDSIQLPNIGSIESSNTHTYFPVWIRTTSPANEVAQARENMQIKLNYLTRKVGA